MEARRLAQPAQQVLNGALQRLAQVTASGLLLPFRPDELYRVPTDDGAAIALGRYRPRGERRFKEPVILCHGLGANRYSLDFDEHYSLARFLARRGFDAWVLELRGRGLAGATAASTTFDDQAQYDARAALKTVLSTGAEAVNWVGHSKGGLVLYAHLAKNPSAPIRAAVTLGAPVHYAAHKGLRSFVARVGPALALDVIPVGTFARSFAFFGLPPNPVGRYLVHEANMEPAVIRQAIANVGADVLGGVARQLARWIQTDQFNSSDETFDYRKHLETISFPLLLIAGAKDLLAPPEAVFPTAKLVRGPTTLLLAGKEGGLLADYGHGDLVLGRRSPEEIFLPIASFLAAHSERLR